MRECQPSFKPSQCLPARNNISLLGQAGHQDTLNEPIIECCLTSTVWFRELFDNSACLFIHAESHTIHRLPGYICICRVARRLASWIMDDYLPFLFLSACLSVFLSVCLSLSLSLSVSMSAWELVCLGVSVCRVCRSVCLLVCLSVCLSVRLSSCLSVSLSVSLCLSVYLFSAVYHSSWLLNVSYYLYCIYLTLTSYTDVWFYLHRCTHITDIGVGYLSTMTSLLRLFLRWCGQLRDFGLQHLYTMKNLKVLSLAGKASN